MHDLAVQGLVHHLPDVPALAIFVKDIEKAWPGQSCHRHRRVPRNVAEGVVETFVPEIPGIQQRFGMSFVNHALSHDEKLKIHSMTRLACRHGAGRRLTANHIEHFVCITLLLDHCVVRHDMVSKLRYQRFQNFSGNVGKPSRKVFSPRTVCSISNLHSGTDSASADRRESVIA